MSTTRTNRIADVATLFESGLSTERVGEQLGVSSETVRRDLRVAGVTPRRRGPAPGSRKIIFSKTDVTERRSRVAQLAALGKTDYAIAGSLHEEPDITALPDFVTRDKPTSSL